MTSSPVGVKNPNTTIANTPQSDQHLTRRGTGGMMWTSAEPRGGGLSDAHAFHPFAVCMKPAPPVSGSRNTDLTSGGAAMNKTIKA